mmetsp:Transcript_29236/g.90850  ORF Transcript_29236/g.90850 Transcript_29236/m.90850 type:complete len:222 (-) Transcript_29236:88-753(-)
MTSLKRWKTEKSVNQTRSLRSRICSSRRWNSAWRYMSMRWFMTWRFILPISWMSLAALVCLLSTRSRRLSCLSRSRRFASIRISCCLSSSTVAARSQSIMFRMLALPVLPPCTQKPMLPICATSTLAGRCRTLSRLVMYVPFSMTSMIWHSDSSLLAEQIKRSPFCQPVLWATSTRSTQHMTLLSAARTRSWYQRPHCTSSGPRSTPSLLFGVFSNTRLSL